MTLFYASISLAVLSSVLYHVFQKATSSAVNPAIGLMVTYGVAFGLSALLLLIYPLKSTVVAALRQVNWASVALAFSILGLELGFLLAYRAGWDIVWRQSLQTPPPAWRFCQPGRCSSERGHRS